MYPSAALSVNIFLVEIVAALVVSPDTRTHASNNSNKHKEVEIPGGNRF